MNPTDFEKFKFLGIFVCEGLNLETTHYRKDRNVLSTTRRTHISIKLHETDFKKEIEELLEKVLPYTKEELLRHGLFFKEHYHKHGEDNYSCSYRMQSVRKEVYEWFKQFLNTNYNKEEILKSEERAKGFLEGFLKSDAFWNEGQRAIEIHSCDEKRAQTIMDCFDYLKIPYNCSIQNNKKGERIVYRIGLRYNLIKDNLLTWFKFNSYRDEKQPDKDINKIEVMNNECSFN